MTTTIGYYRGFSVTDNGDGTAYLRSLDGHLVRAFDASDESLKSIEELVDTRDDAEPKDGSGWCCASCHARSILTKIKQWAFAFAMAGAIIWASFEAAHLIHIWWGRS